MCKWVQGSRDKHDVSGHTLTRDGLNALLRFLVSNTCLACGDSTHGQTIGVPMTTNCAPVLANLFLYHYESSFISRLEEERGRDAARTCHLTFRLIDDVPSLDNPDMKNAVSLMTTEESTLLNSSSIRHRSPLLRQSSSA